MDNRRRRLTEARLYLVCGDQPDAFLDAALRGGVDLIQLRMKTESDEAILSAGERFKRLADRHGALLIVNDRPDLAVRIGADGAHLGQDDLPVAEARLTVGPERLLGLSTHTPAQIDAAARADIDYIGVGPVSETPTKPGRPAVGLELVRYAGRAANVPFFAIGAVNAGNITAVLGAGAQRVAVVRALTEASDPECGARELRRLLTHPREVSVGAA